MSVLDNMFMNIFDDAYTVPFTVQEFITCLLSGLLVGAMISLFYATHNEHTESFISAVFLLPAVVAIIIVTVKDSIGAGIAVMGAFALVRFRSTPGKAKEITAIFIAMGSGLLIGVGYIGYALLLTVLLGIILIAFHKINEPEEAAQPGRLLRVTIPEDLNYTTVFDDIFDKYTTYHRRIRVKTTNMGSMYRLTYEVSLADPAREKEMIDAIRSRNGNLEVSLSEIEESDDSL